LVPFGGGSHVNEFGDFQGGEVFAVRFFGFAIFPILSRVSPGDYSLDFGG